MPGSFPAIVVAGLIGHAFAQTGPSLIGASYTTPPLLRVSPGQIVRLQLTGLQTNLPNQSVQAASVPLPVQLAGLSVKVNEYTKRFQADPFELTGSFTAPVVSVRQISLCSLNTKSSNANCLSTYITVQIPYELRFNNVGNPFYSHEIVISENGNESPPFNVAVVDDKIHVVTDCDQRETANGCHSIVTHADGSLVSPQSPGIAGETVVVYAWGLGYTTPSVKTGNLTPAPAPISALQGEPDRIRVWFDFRPNGPSWVFGPAQAKAVTYLTPGQVGLYQIAVQLPSRFPAVLPCDPAVQSNLTINLSGVWSSDAAAICVQPGE